MLVPRKTHHVRSLQQRLRVGLKRAQTLHAQTFPLTAFVALAHLIPCFPCCIELRRGASAKVIHTHSNAPHRYTEQLFYVGVLYTFPLFFFRLSPSDYLGLHQRYARLLGDDPQTLSLSKEQEQIRKQLSELFDGMMRTLYSQKGSEFRIEVLAEPKVQEFINAHAGALDSTFKQVEMSDTMRRKLQQSDYIFSGIKTFHELNQAFPSLLDENGNRKPFERFLNDVQNIENNYNSHYLRAEYNFVQSSAQMAAKWEQFAEDGDRYNLQYRTANDSKMQGKPPHIALNLFAL